MIGVNASAEVVEIVSKSMQGAQQPVKRINVSVMGHMVVKQMVMWLVNLPLNEIHCIKNGKASFMRLC